jgi:hypothetical protein
MSDHYYSAPAMTDFVLPPLMLHSQQVYRLKDSGASNRSLKVDCLDVTQRNWSRVATGLTQDPSTGQSAVFLKQYVDRTGAWNEKLWAYERAGVEIAETTLGRYIGIPKLVASDHTLLINAFEHAEILSMDELLRADSAAFARAYPVALECMLGVLQQLQNPALAEPYRLPKKARDYGDGTLCLNFKGFELRNMGMKTTIAGIPEPEDFYLFDFGRPYLAPIQEAAAKLFISVGLLNWGRPLSRFNKGPDFALLELARLRLSPYLDRKAIEAELRLQRSFRFAEIRGKGSIERKIKQLAISTLGRYYFHHLEDWCRSSIA